MTLDVKNFFYSPFNFVLCVEVLTRPTLNTYQFTLTLTNLLFLRKSASVATSRLRIFTLLLPTVAGIALDVLGNRKVKLFRHTNTGGFLFGP
jgi:hypothetical protein